MLAAPAQIADVNRNAGHSLTLDGQADTDYYDVWTTGSRFSKRNYVINVLDTGFALMAWPTMIATLILAPRVMKATRDYFSRLKSSDKP